MIAGVGVARGDDAVLGGVLAKLTTDPARRVSTGATARSRVAQRDPADLLLREIGVLYAECLS